MLGLFRRKGKAPLSPCELKELLGLVIHFNSKGIYPKPCELQNHFEGRASAGIETLEKQGLLTIEPNTKQIKTTF